jgi:hypothetical protein
VPFSLPEVAGMSRYVGLFVLLLGTLLLVNFASDFLYARAIAAQPDEEEPVIAAATAPEPLPLTGLVRAPTGRWGQGRLIGASAAPMVQSAESCTNSVASIQR